MNTASLSTPPSATTNKISNTRGMRLFIPLLAITLLPLLSLPILSSVDYHFDDIPLINWAIFFGGVGHVASTVFFFGDKKAYPIMTPMKLRFFLVPPLVIAITVLTVLFNESIHIPKTVVAILFFTHLCWLHYHYQKQNYGLIALTAAGSDKRLPKTVLTLVMLPALAGGLAVIPELLSIVVKVDTPLTPYYQELKQLGQLVYIAAVIALVLFIRKHGEVFSQPVITLFTAAAFLFFLPAVAVGNIYYAFWSYALAHGFQYLLMLAFVAGSSASPIRLVLLFMVAAGAGAAAMSRLHGSDALLLCGVFLTWVHFILDARLWKMSEAEPRTYLRGRFRFLFERR